MSKPRPNRHVMLIVSLIGVGILVGAALFFTSLSADDLFQMGLGHLAGLHQLAQSHHHIAVMVYLAAYIGLVSLSVPGAMWLSILGGVLFGVGEGVVYALFAATTGATFAYLVGRHVLTHWIKTRTGHHLAAIKAGFKKDAFNYLLFLRLMPGCPFVVVNLAVAALTVKLPTYILATLLGILPSTTAQVLIGVGLRQVASLKHLSISDVALNPAVMAGCIAAAAVSVLPIAYHRLHGKAHS